MRSGMIILGVVFLIMGGVLYLNPQQWVTANTATSGTTGTDVRTSSASIFIPPEWSYAMGIIGFILLALGLAIPDSTNTSNYRKNERSDTYDKVVETKNSIDVGDSFDAKVIKERHVTHKIRNT